MGRADGSGLDGCVWCSCVMAVLSCCVHLAFCLSVQCTDTVLNLRHVIGERGFLGSSSSSCLHTTKPQRKHTNSLVTGPLAGEASGKKIGKYGSKIGKVTKESCLRRGKTSTWTFFFFSNSDIFHLRR